LLKRLLATMLLCVIAAAQQKTLQKTPPAKPAPPPIPVFDIKLTPDDSAVSIAYPDNAPMIPALCDANGNPFVKVYGTDGMHILAFTPKGAIPFDTRQITDVPEPELTNYFFVRSSGIFLLVLGMENTRKEEQSIIDEQGREGKRLVTKGEYRYYIARFDRDGTYKGALKLDSGFHYQQLAAFDSGVFVVAGLDENNTPRVALLNSSGQMLTYVQLPKDITDRPKSAAKSFEASFGSTASMDVITGSSQFFSYNENVLLERAGNIAPIYEIRESGEVRAVRLKIPNGLTLDHFIPSDHNWFIAVRKDPNDMASETIYEVNPENGEPLRQYRIESKNGFEEALSCATQDGFTGIRHKQGRLTVLHGVAEPAKQQASPAPK